MRELITSNPNTTIDILDEPGDGGANHKYIIRKFDDIKTVFSDITFQKGQLKEND